MLKVVLQSGNRELRMLRQRLRDLKSDTRFADRQLEKIPSRYEPVATFAQPIRPGKDLHNKIGNLYCAIRSFDRLVIKPGELFSFWQRVGRPTKRRGYGASRMLREGKLMREVGGGLCQVSGLLYWLALHLDMTIVERHAHSVDIYDETTRFAPLGSDATVVFGYRDLRFRNDTARPVALAVRLEQSSLVGIGYATEPLRHQIQLDRNDLGDGRKVVRTFRVNRDQRTCLAETAYRSRR